MRHDIAGELRWLTVADLAVILGLRPQTIYNRLCACPETLPPATRVPRLRGPRWSARVVREWQAQFDPPTGIETPVKRGRPKKGDSIRRRLRSELEAQRDLFEPDG